MRRDARRNRARLVADARDVFAREGVEAPLDAIARRAGVGAGTLYRHFPTREALVEAIFAERIDTLLAVGEAALESEDARSGFVGYLEATLEHQSRDRVLKEVFLRYPPGEGRVADARQQILDLLGRMLDRAQRDGVVREDLGVADLVLLLWSFGPVIDATADVAPDAWRRHLRVVLDGLSPAAATPQDQGPLDEAQLSAAMSAMHRHRFGRGQTRTRRAA